MKSIEDQLDTMIMCTEQAERIGLYEHVSRNPDSYLACKVESGLKCNLLNLPEIKQKLRAQINTHQLSKIAGRRFAERSKS